MTTDERINAALSRCPALGTRTLEDFLGTLLDEDLEVLAQLPGTPGQVMAAQFTHYVRSAVNLAENHTRNTEHSGHLADTLLRLPAVRKNSKTRRVTDGAASPGSQAAA